MTWWMDCSEGQTFFCEIFIAKLPEKWKKVIASDGKYFK